MYLQTDAVAGLRCQALSRFIEHLFTADLKQCTLCQETLRPRAGETEFCLCSNVQNQWDMILYMCWSNIDFPNVALRLQYNRHNQGPWLHFQSCDSQFAQLVLQTHWATDTLGVATPALQMKLPPYSSFTDTMIN